MQCHTYLQEEFMHIHCSTAGKIALALIWWKLTRCFRSTLLGWYALHTQAHVHTDTHRNKSSWFLLVTCLCTHTHEIRSSSSAFFLPAYSHTHTRSTVVATLFLLPAYSYTHTPTATYTSWYAHTHTQWPTSAGTLIRIPTYCPLTRCSHSRSPAHTVTHTAWTWC